MHIYWFAIFDRVLLTLWVWCLVLYHPAIIYGIFDFLDFLCLHRFFKRSKANHPGILLSISVATAYECAFWKKIDSRGHPNIHYNRTKSGTEWSIRKRAAKVIPRRLEKERHSKKAGLAGVGHSPRLDWTHTAYETHTLWLRQSITLLMSRNIV